MCVDAHLSMKVECSDVSGFFQTIHFFQVEPLRWQGGKPGQNRLERTFSESSEAKLGVPCSGTKG